ncbi:MAG: SDR family oxidoreductase [Candidatus Berkelbacteria bacterium]|nr:SDR family oxidoreductase [Candidatus Berkelbacteria bacterium]
MQNQIKNKLVMVTGATSGIGKEAAKMLASDGARVIIVGRNQEKCQQTVKEIITETKNKNLEYLLADFQYLGEIRLLAEKFHTKYDKLDVLINNAGVYLKRRETTADGRELSFSVNYLAPFFLTNLLLPALKKSDSARIINVSSLSHLGAKIDFDDIFSEKSNQHPKFAYRRSKLALIMFTYELARQLKNSNITVNAVCPGGVATALWKTNNDLQTKATRLIVPLLKTPQQAAGLLVYLAESPEANNISGKFFALKKHSRFRNYNYKNTISKSSPESYILPDQKKLWQVSKELVGFG